MAWIFIVLASLDEIDRSFCHKLGWVERDTLPLWVGFGSVCMAIGALIPRKGSAMAWVNSWQVRCSINETVVFSSRNIGGRAAASGLLPPATRQQSTPSTR